MKHKASESKIKATYRRLALEYHPDKGGTQQNVSKLAFYNIIKKDNSISSIMKKPFSVTEQICFDIKGFPLIR